MKAIICCRSFKSGPITRIACRDFLSVTLFEMAFQGHCRKSRASIDARLWQEAAFQEPGIHGHQAFLDEMAAAAASHPHGSYIFTLRRLMACYSASRHFSLLTPADTLIVPPPYSCR